jgi:hypothetical protein
MNTDKHKLNDLIFVTQETLKEIGEDEALRMLNLETGGIDDFQKKEGNR